MKDAEDAVQDAFAIALERWPRTGVPDNPGAWIVTTARNRAIDRIRRDHVLADQDPTLWDSAAIDEGLRMLARAEAQRRPGVIPGLGGYRHFHSARADLLRRLGREEDARDAYERAFELTEDGPERRFLERRLGETTSRHATMTPCVSLPESTTPSEP